jgi:hypothetical protein
MELKLYLKCVLLFVYISIVTGDPIIKMVMVWITETPPHFCACPKSGHGLFVFSELR